MQLGEWVLGFSVPSSPRQIPGKAGRSVHKKPIDQWIMLAKGHARCSKLMRQWIRLLKKLMYAFDRRQGKRVLALAPTFISTKRRGSVSYTHLTLPTSDLV